MWSTQELDKASILHATVSFLLQKSSLAPQDLFYEISTLLPDPQPHLIVHPGPAAKGGSTLHRATLSPSSKSVQVLQKKPCPSPHNCQNPNSLKPHFKFHLLPGCSALNLQGPHPPHIPGGLCAKSGNLVSTMTPRGYLSSKHSAQS